MEHGQDSYGMVNFSERFLMRMVKSGKCNELIAKTNKFNVKSIHANFDNLS